MVNTLELWLGRIGGGAGLATLTVAIWNMVRSLGGLLPARAGLAAAREKDIDRRRA